MKNKIIRINEVTDIDTSKISVYDLNNRYIDRRGNMYSLRYNKSHKKIEIIQIMRTHTKDATYFQKKIIQKKISESLNPVKEDIEHNFIDMSDDESELAFDPDSFINNSIELMMTHRERLQGIIMNLRNSNIMPHDNKGRSAELEEIFRNIDIDGVQNFEKAENYQKELINYPRSITYYQAKIDKKGRDIIEGLGGHTDRIMKFIYVYEMFHTIKTLYRGLKKIIFEMDTLLKEIDPDIIKKINQFERQSYNDAEVSIANTIEEIEETIDGLRKFEEYVYNIKNF